MRLVVDVADRDTAGSAPIPSHPFVLYYLHLRPLPVDTDAYQLLECYVRVSAKRQLSSVVVAVVEEWPELR